MGTRLVSGFDDENPDVWRFEGQHPPQWPVGAAEPQPDECLPCYVARMRRAYGCNGSMRWVQKWENAATIAVAGLVDWLRDNGGYCDCEVLYNVYADHSEGHPCTSEAVEPASCTHGRAIRPEADRS
jgi:hypothetical protein